MMKNQWKDKEEKKKKTQGKWRVTRGRKTEGAGRR